MEHPQREGPAPRTDPMSVTASTTMPRGSPSATAPAIARMRGSSDRMRSGVKNKSTTARNRACSGGSSELGTARWADAADEYVTGSLSVRTVMPFLIHTATGLQDPDRTSARPVSGVQAMCRHTSPHASPLPRGAVAGVAVSIPYVWFSAAC